MLFDRLRQDRDAARISRDAVLANLLGTVVGDGETIGKARENRPPTDDEVNGILRKFAKGARETSEQLRKRGDSGETLAKYEREIEILEGYLPKRADEGAVRDAAMAFKSENPDANVGAVMAHLKAKFGGALDGKSASEIVRSL